MMEVFFRNLLQDKRLVFRRDLCSGCGDCITVCPQGFLRPVGGPKKAVGWKARTIPEPAGGVCAECNLCLPTNLGGGQKGGEPPVICPWRVCTMCDLCTQVCPDKAIFTLPLTEEDRVEAETGLAKGGRPSPGPRANLPTATEVTVNYVGHPLGGPRASVR